MILKLIMWHRFPSPYKQKHQAAQVHRYILIAYVQTMEGKKKKKKKKEADDKKYGVIKTKLQQSLCIIYNDDFSQKFRDSESSVAV